MQLASGGGGPEGDFTSRCASAGVFTNQIPALRLLPAARSNPAPGFDYSLPPSQEKEMPELNEPSLASRAYLANPAPAASPQGWRIGVAGVVDYTARSRRWRIVFGYAPDLGALREREDFSDIHSFSVAWQFRLGKQKPASWAGVTTGSEYLRRPAAH